MIDDMVDVLKKEQNDDDAQVNEAQKTLDEKKALERKIKDHNAAIDDMDSQIAALKSGIETLNANIKALDKEVSEATEQRKAENEEALKTQQELTLTLDLLKHVKNRLNKFYNPKLYVPPPQQEELTEEERIAQ